MIRIPPAFQRDVRIGKLVAVVGAFLLLAVGSCCGAAATRLYDFIRQ